MAIRYSKSANGFFIDGVSPSIPADAVPVSQAAWQHLLAGQGETSQISSDSAGNPVLIDPTQQNKVIWTSVGVT